MGRQFCVACVWHLCVLHAPKDIQDKVFDRISTKRCNSIDNAWVYRHMSVHSNMKPLRKNFVIRITFYQFIVVFGFSEVHGTENPLNKRQAPDAWCRQGSAIQRDLLDRKMKQKVDPNTRRVAQVRTELFKNEFLHSLLCKVAYWM